MQLGVLVYILAVVVAGVAGQWLGWRLRIPAIVLLLGTGLLLGPATGILHPSRDLGPLLHPLMGLAVALIVFEGGLNLRLSELRKAGPGVRRLVAAALPLNWGLGTLAAHWAGGLPWGPATLVGAILTVTGPTVILPLLRQARLQKHPATLLKWEAVVNDPIGALLTVVTLQALLLSGGQGLWALLPALAVSVAAGVALAWGVRAAFLADLVPESLGLPVLVAGTLGLYAAGNALFPEAGLVAATVFGIGLANLPVAGSEHLTRTLEAITVLLVSTLFILLAADLDREQFAQVSWRLPAFVAAMVLVARPLSIVLATVGDHLPWRERALLAWIAPRGIVAAAISGLAGGQLAEAGVAGAENVQPMVFAVIAATVLTQGLSLAPTARLLGLRNSERPGLLVVGMSPWALRLAQALNGAGVPVVLADRSWQSLRPAREAGLKTAALEIMSERAEELIEGSGMDYLLAATEDDAYNALVCARLAPVLGRQRVHQLALGSGRLDRHSVPSRSWRGKVVTDAALDVGTLNALFDEGWCFLLRPAEQPGSGEEKMLLTIHRDGGLEFHSPDRPARFVAGDLAVVFKRV
jgi:NhaP-type Na+/H+ or K+/H+ antiporter